MVTPFPPEAVFAGSCFRREKLKVQEESLDFRD